MGMLPLKLLVLTLEEGQPCNLSLQFHDVSVLAVDGSVELLAASDFFSEVSIFY